MSHQWIIEIMLGGIKHYVGTEGRGNYGIYSSPSCLVYPSMKHARDMVASLPLWLQGECNVTYLEPVKA